MEYPSGPYLSYGLLSRGTSCGESWYKLESAIITQYIQRTDLRPFAQILCYPVITAGAYAHEESIQNLLQEHAEDEQLRNHVSLELQVHKDVPEPFCGIPIPIQRFPYKILCCLPLPW